LPPSEEASRAERWLYEGRSHKTGVDAHELLDGFIDRTDRVLQLVEGFVPESAWLSDSETLTYLHSTISTRRHRVRLPETPMHLDALLADEPLTCGLEPRLGNAHLQILTIIGFPTATFPGILDELNRSHFLIAGPLGRSASTRPRRRGCSSRSAGNGSPSASRSWRSSKR
jgi:type IV secretion system protein TrbE